MKKRILSVILTVIVAAQTLSMLIIPTNAWSWDTDGKYKVNSYNASIVSDGTITVDAKLDHLYLTGTKITNHNVPFVRSSYSAEAKALADGTFFAYVAADTKGMYIYTEVNDKTIASSLNTNGNDGDMVNIYFDWVNNHPTPEERTSGWSASDYMSTYGKDQNLGWLSADYKGNIKGSRGFASYNMFGPNKNQAAVYKYRLTDSGWACEWFIPWKDEAQSKAIAKGEQIPCGIGFEVGDDSELSDGNEQNVNIYYDQRHEICTGYYADYSKLSDITFVKGYDTEKNICTVAKKSRYYL